MLIKQKKNHLSDFEFIMVKQFVSNLPTKDKE